MLPDVVSTKLSTSVTEVTIPTTSDVGIVSA